MALLFLLWLFSVLETGSSIEGGVGSYPHHREPHNDKDNGNKSINNFYRIGNLGSNDYDLSELRRLVYCSSAAEEAINVMSNEQQQQQRNNDNHAHETTEEEKKINHNDTTSDGASHLMGSRYRPPHQPNQRQDPAVTSSNRFVFDAWRFRDNPSEPTQYEPSEPADFLSSSEEEGEDREEEHAQLPDPSHFEPRDYLFRSLHEEDSEDEGLFPPSSLPRASHYDEDSDASVDEEGNMVPDFPSPSAAVPLAYRFYRRAIYRQRDSDSLPFVLLGPNADHWKATAQVLAASGFSVICCERVYEDSPQPDDNEDGGLPNKSRELSGSDSAKVISDLLDALRWGRAVLVACDSESVLAIQAAMQLAPDRIVGLVICGQLDDAEEFVNNPQGRRGLRGSDRQKSLWGSFVVDGFLRQHVKCPALVVWEGDGDTMSQQLQDITANVAPTLIPEAMHYVNVLAQERAEILGSGSAPHRKLPQLLAWHLTRFVEQKISPPSESSNELLRTPSHASDRSLYALSNGNSGNMLFDEISQFFSQEGMVVFGRIAANVLFWGIALRAGIFQYHNFRNGIFDFHTKLTLLSSAPARLFALIGRIFTFSPWASKHEETQDRAEETTKENANVDELDNIVEGEEEDRALEAPQIEETPTDPVDDKSNMSDADAEPNTPENELNEENINEPNDFEQEGKDDEEEEGFIPNYFLDFVLCQTRILTNVSYV